MTTTIADHYVPELGLNILDDHERVDFAGLRQARRERVLAMMEGADLDACVFGRQANVRYVSGARRLWLPETMVFSPICVVVRATRTVRVLSASASMEGFPEAFQPEDILLNTYDPARAVARIAETPGWGEARRVGVDGMTPGFAQLFQSRFPKPVLVQAEGLMRGVRRRKLPAEVTCLRTAAAIAEACLQAAIGRLSPGAPQKALQAAYLARMCELGVQTFAQIGTFTTIGPGGELSAMTRDGQLPDGAPVALAGGALWAGYEGSLARTWWCGGEPPGPAARAPYRCWSELVEGLLAACRPGATGASLQAAFEASRPPEGASFSIDALGLGVEGKVAGTAVDLAVAAAQRLEADMVIGLRVFAPGVDGGYLGEDMFLIGEHEPEVLTTLGAGPIAREPLA
jgi:Xaa-Pro aminopeptidase